MAPLEYDSSSNIGNITLIGGWISGGFAIVFLGLVIISRLISNRHFGLDDFLLGFATLIALVLAGQTTWAVLDEGQGQSEKEETVIQAMMVIKVLEIEGWGARTD